MHIQNIIADSEKRILQRIDERFKALDDRISNLEVDMKAIKSVQVQQETNVNRIREVIEQRQIESFDEEQRRCNLIIAKMPEGEVTINKVPIAYDREKFVALANLILPQEAKTNANEVVKAVRLGRRGGDEPCVMKVKLQHVASRNTILRFCRNLNSPPSRATNVWKGLR